jgi:hypothetical protein
MKTGTAYYNLFGIGIFRLKKRFSVPESFAEMSRKQLLWYAENVYMKYPELFRTVTRPALREPQVPASPSPSSASGGGPYEETVTLPIDEKNLVALMILALKELSNLPGWIYWMLQADQLHDLIFQQQLMNFLFTPYFSEDNPMETLTLRVPQGAGLKGPEGIDAITTEQFAFADACFMNWHKEQHKPNSEKDLDSFIYHLYCPDHNTSVVHHATLTQVQKVPAAAKVLVMLWYMGHRVTYPRLYRHLFSKQNERAASGHGSWITIILSAGGGIAHYNKVKVESHTLFLMDCDRLLKAQKELKEEMEKRRN